MSSNTNYPQQTPQPPVSVPPSIRVVFSTSAVVADNLGSKFDFRRHEQILLDDFLHDRQVTIQSRNFLSMSLMDQVQLALQSTIFVMGCGGGGDHDGSAVSMATFLPRGATLIVLYNEVGGETGNDVAVSTPTRPDWDLLNNLAYLRVHWLPTGTMTTNEDFATFSDLIRREVNFHRSILE